MSPEFNNVQDSGIRQNFKTGSRRDTRTGKGRYDLLSPIVMRRDAKHLENGAVKYGDRNWEVGQPLSRYLDSALRHIHDYVYSCMLDIEPDEDHLAAARWNLACIMHTEEMIGSGNLPKELDDMSDYFARLSPAEDQK